MSGLFVETQGHGDAHVVLLHGWAMHGGVFAPLTAALAERATVHVVDLPGHGRSRDCDVPLTLAACAEAVAAATPPAAWLGWSLGGLVALQAAATLAAQVTGLAMVCASPRFVRGNNWRCAMDASMLMEFRSGLASDYAGTIKRFLSLEAMGGTHAHADARCLRGDVFARGEPDPRVLQQGLDLLCHSDLRELLPDLGQPSTWIAGRRDRLVPPAAMQWSAERCGGRFHCVPHAGHAPFIGATDAVVEALAPLLPPRAAAAGVGAA